MRLGDHRPPDFFLGRGKAKLGKILGDRVGVENAQHAFFAKGGWHGRQAQFNLAAGRGAGLDAAILRPALFGYVHAAKNLQATGHRAHHCQWQAIDGMQHPVDAQANLPLFAARLQVNIAGALGKGVLQQPVDDLHDRPFVGTRLAAPAQFQQLLEVENALTSVQRALERATHRARYAIKLQLVTADVERIGDHPRDIATQGVAQHLDPLAQPGLGGGEHHLGIIGGYRQDLVATGIFVGDEGQQAFNCGDVEFKRIDAQVG